MDDLGVPPWLRKPPIYTYWDNTISHDYGTNPITRMICETSGYRTCEGPPTSIIGRLTLKKWVGYWNSWSISKIRFAGFSNIGISMNFPFYGRCFWHFQWKSSMSLPKEGATSFFYAHNSLSCKKVYILYDIIYILLNSYIQQMYLSPLNLPSHFQYLSDLSVICCRYLSTIKHSNGTLPTCKGCSLYLYLISH